MASALTLPATAMWRPEPQTALETAASIAFVVAVIVAIGVVSLVASSLWKLMNGRD